MKKISNKLSWFERSRFKLFLAWIIIIIIFALPTNFISCIIFSFNNTLSDYYGFTLLKFIGSTTVLLPFGILVNLLLPWGWISIVSFLYSFITKKFWPLYISIIPTIISAYLWPSIFIRGLSI